MCVDVCFYSPQAPGSRHGSTTRWTKLYTALLKVSRATSKGLSTRCSFSSHTAGDMSKARKMAMPSLPTPQSSGSVAFQLPGRGARGIDASFQQPGFKVEVGEMYEPLERGEILPCSAVT